MVEMIAHRVLDDAHRLKRCQLVLGLALELRLADEHREQSTRRGHHIVRRDDRRALVAGQFGIVLERPGECGAKALLMGAAIRRRDGVAIGRRETILAAKPRHRPFDRAVASFFLDAAGEDVIDHPVQAIDALGEEVFQAAGEMQRGFLGRVLVLDEGGIA